ncbi:MAG: DNA double-strand break repair nuclease NurA [Candidatus Babeliales bacterium]|nr:DNA double-strand break repair nuclease NurA [Candidatus Babeliales bacterium]
MLNKARLFKEIEKISDAIFYDYSKELEIAEQNWQAICQDEEFPVKAKNSLLPMILPTWQDAINTKTKVDPISEYTLVSVDGSQIYPDRHQGTSCFLLNIGSVILHYGKNSNVKFDSVPYLFSSMDEENSTDVVDCRRQEYEFKAGLEIMSTLVKEYDKPLLFIFDGSIIFWHLESKSPAVSSTYLGKYLGLMHQFYKEKLLMAGYISLPKSKELVNLIRVKLSESVENYAIDNIVDTQVAAFYLNENEHTTLFENHSGIVSEYPEHLKPYFVYFDIGAEIVRIEIPAWIAQDSAQVKLVLSIILDQCIKGYGFPVALAEAHEQAVVKGFEREQFYELLQKLSYGYKQKISTSLKSNKKRRMGI